MDQGGILEVDLIRRVIDNFAGSNRFKTEAGNRVAPVARTPQSQ